MPTGVKTRNDISGIHELQTVTCNVRGSLGMLDGMKTPSIFRLDQLSVVDVSGADAGKILHNLTTNEVLSLQDGEGRETFVTDVRGKILGHVCLFRHQGGFRLVGPSGQSDAISSHVDRYTIREDAVAESRDSDHVGFVISPSLARQCGLAATEGVILKSQRIQRNAITVDVFGVRWLGAGSALLCIHQEDSERIPDALVELLADNNGSQSANPVGMEVGNETDFHEMRVIAGYPWFGIDLDDSNLPQEADRDAETISFTKGCYLGQETVARLDAMGQVQKKLVRWKITGGVPAPDTVLSADEKKVGRLTSIAASDQDGVTAIGFARRSHFEAGATATAVIESGADGGDGDKVTGTVF